MASRKDYIAVAGIIYKATFAAVTAQDTREYIARHLATMYEEQNPRFDRARFIAACGVPSEEQ